MQPMKTVRSIGRARLGASRVASGSVLSAALAVALGALVPATALAQAAPSAVQPAQSGTTGSGPGWAAKTQAKPQVAATTLDEKQVAIVKKVSAYFTELDNLKGQFVQTGADNKKMRGKFFVKKPGQFRFEYALPSKMIIISDGVYLAVQDHDINTDDRIALDNTVFRILLKKDVDLLRDAQLLEVAEANDMIVLALQDRGGESNGSIRLFLAKGPTLELKEWVTTDAQGLDTRMELSSVTRGEEIDSKLFKPAPLAAKQPSGG